MHQGTQVLVDKTRYKSFDKLKKNIRKAFTLDLLNFDLAFEVNCDASNNGIGTVLNQERCPIIFFFNEKLNDVKLQYSIYDKKFDKVI